VIVVGHGIDTNRFHCIVSAEKTTGRLRLVTIGRISRAKNIHILVQAVRVLADQGLDVHFDIIGEGATKEDRMYAGELKKEIENAGSVKIQMLGAKTQEEVAALLCGYDFFLHASTGTGSVDKAVLEPLSCGVPAVSSSEAFRELLGSYGLFAAAGTPEAIADAVVAFEAKGSRKEVMAALRAAIIERYSLAKLIPSILTALGA
jgi:colanic acid/amylovoran biosynthesis glycosyltransferase